MQYNQPYGVSDPNAPYINGNPSTGTQGSIPPAASIEYPQRELVNLITDAGRALPTNSDLHQLSKAVQSGLINYAVDVGTPTQLQITLTPDPGTPFAGLGVTVKAANVNGANPTLNVNGHGALPIISATSMAAVPASSWLAGQELSLVCDGTSWQYIGGGATTQQIKNLIFNPNIIKFTTPGAWSWTVPAGITVARFYAWGAGGGGGFSATSGGSGGGGGCYAEQPVTVTPGGTLSGVIGTGGAAATSIAADGSAGGATTVINSTGPITYTMSGGAGGHSGNGVNNSVSGGGATNIAANGIVHVGQPSGGTIQGYSGSGILAYAGNGGTSALGGVAGLGGTGGGNSGQPPGSGGAGSGNSQAAGAGARGELWIYF